MRACSPRRPSNSLADSHQRDEGRSEPRCDRPGLASHQQGCRHAGRDEPRDHRASHRSALLPHAHGEVRRECRQPTGNDSGNGGRPSAKQIQLNKQITAARDAEGILAIVETEHGEFNAVNTATACSRLAKMHRGSAHDPGQGDRGMRQLLSTINRVAPSMEAQAVANTIWGLATLGWQAGEGAMRGALEGAAVRVAPSMNAQAVANTIWGLAKLGWQAAEGLMRDALEGAAVRVAPTMNAQNVANIIWGLVHACHSRMLWLQRRGSNSRSAERIACRSSGSADC